MKTAYVATMGDYSDYRIYAVFSSREKFNEWLPLFKHAHDGGVPELEEWDIDPETPVSPLTGYLPWYMEFGKDGTFERELTFVEVESAAAKIIPCLRWDKKSLGVTCWAKELEDAVKIGHELWAQFVALGCWDGDKPDHEKWTALTEGEA